MLYLKRNITSSEVMSGATDFHSHILHGVDDGIKTQEEALLALAYMETLGVSSIVCTPHIMSDYPQNRPDFLRQKFDQLQCEYKGNIELLLGAEYMLDETFARLLDSGELLPVYDNFLLIETSYFNQPVNFDELINLIHSKGYNIVLAHPERYLYMDKHDYDFLKSKRLYFQLNLLSLSGFYGKSTQLKAKHILSRNYYDCIGSDIHNVSQFQRGINRLNLSRSAEKKLMTLKLGMF